MGRIFTVPWTGTVTNAGGNVDLWEFLPADDLPCRLRGLRLGQISEVADAAEEGLGIEIIRMRATVTSGSGGSAGAPEATDRANTAPGFAVEVNNTTVATTSGDTEVLEDLGWNNRMTPFEIWYPDRDFAPTVIQGEALLIRQLTTAADDYTFSGTAWIEEG